MLLCCYTQFCSSLCWVYVDFAGGEGICLVNLFFHLLFFPPAYHTCAILMQLWPSYLGKNSLMVREGIITEKAEQTWLSIQHGTSINFRGIVKALEIMCQVLWWVNVWGTALWESAQLIILLLHHHSTHLQNVGLVLFHIYTYPYCS